MAEENEEEGKTEEQEAVQHEKRKKMSKLQERLQKIRSEARVMEEEHKENVRIIHDTIEAYTHMPELNKFVKNMPAHQVQNKEDELHPSHKDGEKYVEREAYRDINIPNPWWQVPGVRTVKTEGSSRGMR